MGETSRDVEILVITGREAVPEVLGQRFSIPFSCLLTSRDVGAEVDALNLNLVRSLLRAGCRYFVCVGKESERDHDAIDRVIVDEGFFAEELPLIMTTWHDDEPIIDTVDFFLHAVGLDDSSHHPRLAIVDFHNSADMGVVELLRERARLQGIAVHLVGDSLANGK